MEVSIAKVEFSIYIYIYIYIVVVSVTSAVGNTKYNITFTHVACYMFHRTQNARKY